MFSPDGFRPPFFGQHAGQFGQKRQRKGRGGIARKAKGKLGHTIHHTGILVCRPGPELATIVDAHRHGAVRRLGDGGGEGFEHAGHIGMGRRHVVGELHLLGDGSRYGQDRGEGSPGKA